jgi:RNA polymerase sigma factor for flagellar operon FliA
MEKNELKIQYLPISIDAEEYQREWDAYLAERSIERRNKIAEWNLGLVYSVAKALRDRNLKQIEMDDLVGYGVIGLLEAIERYDPAFDVSFGTFALPRVMGSILRGMEKWIGIPRRLFRKKCQIDMACETMSQRLQREPDDHEVAQYLEMSLEEYRKLQWQIASQMPQSYEEAEMAASESFEDECERKCLIEQLMARFWQLSKEERQVLHLVFGKGCSLRKIGEKQGNSRWRVQRIYNRALRRLSRGIL